MNTNHQKTRQMKDTDSNDNRNDNQHNKNNIEENPKSHQEQTPTERQIHKIFSQLNHLQTQQLDLIQELQDLTDSMDPPGIKWIYPNPDPET